MLYFYNVNDETKQQPINNKVMKTTMTFDERLEMKVAEMDTYAAGTILSYYDDDMYHAVLTKTAEGTWHDEEYNNDFAADEIAGYLVSGQATNVMFKVA